MPLILPARTLDSGYEIDNSLRFNRSDSAYLSRTTGSDGNKRTWTWSAWIKRSNVNSSTMGFFAVEIGGGGQLSFLFNNSGSNNELDVQENVSGVKWRKITNQVFRDPSAFYHILLAFDSTQSTPSNRLKLYVNGSQVTSFSTDTNPDQNYDSILTTASSPTNIGKYSNHYFDGYMSDVYLIDGSALAPTEFGETNDNGVWIPKRFSGSYGTNGFKLEFKNSGSLGTDTSGNGNNFTPTNLTATDQTTDTPTNNFATLNPINKFASPVVTEGNLKFDSNSSSGSSMVSTIAPSNGKWYVEVKALTSTIAIGVSEVGKESFNVKGQGASRPNINYQYGGGVEIDGSIIDNEATFTSNDILGFALNLDDGELIIYKNGTALNSGTAYNLHTNTTHGNTGFSVQTHTGGGNTKASFNFGNPAFSISSGNADANGFGNFEYAVPSGYYSLCTKNLAEYG